MARGGKILVSRSGSPKSNSVNPTLEVLVSQNTKSLGGITIKVRLGLYYGSLLKLTSVV